MLLVIVERCRISLIPMKKFIQQVLIWKLHSQMLGNEESQMLGNEESFLRNRNRTLGLSRSNESYEKYANYSSPRCIRNFTVPHFPTLSVFFYNWRALNVDRLKGPYAWLFVREACQNGITRTKTHNKEPDNLNSQVLTIWNDINQTHFKPSLHQLEMIKSPPSTSNGPSHQSHRKTPKWKSTKRLWIRHL